LQGIRMSGFLETNTEPGQRKLSDFLRQDANGAEPVPKPPRSAHGWNQTFLPREVRDTIDRQMQEHVAERDARASGDADVLNPALLHHLPWDVQKQSGGATLGSGKARLQLAEAANCSQLPDEAAAAAADEAAAGPAELPAGTQTTQGSTLVLTLRDWVPPTASQVLRVQQSEDCSRSSPGSGGASAAGDDAGGEMAPTAGELSEAEDDSVPEEVVHQLRDILDTADAGEKSFWPYSPVVTDNCLKLQIPVFADSSVFGCFACLSKHDSVFKMVSRQEHHCHQKQMVQVSGQSQIWRTPGRKPHQDWEMITID
jgi:hypothetical protein